MLCTRDLKKKKKKSKYVHVVYILKEIENDGED